MILLAHDFVHATTATVVACAKLRPDKKINFSRKSDTDCFKIWISA